LEATVFANWIFWGTRLADSEKSVPDSTIVDCLTCHERIGVSLTDRPQTIRCTFCDAPVKVPSREQVRQKEAAKAARTPAKLEGYELALPADNATSKLEAKKAVRSRSGGNSSSAVPTITLECPTCHELVKARVGPKPGRVTCTFCEVLISVPDLRTVEGWRAKTVKTRSAQEIGDYAHGPIPESQPMRLGNVFDRLAEVRQEVAPTPPRWTFFSGVFTLPWRRQVVTRWVYMSIGFCAMLGIAVILRMLAASFSGMASGVAVAFFLLPIIWISFFTLSYTAACCLHVFESTVSGLDEIEAWPESNWRDWMTEMMYVAWIGAVPLGIGLGLGKFGTTQDIPLSLTIPVAFFVLYPISFMSAMEANSVWVPLTLPILGSLARWWWCWLLFYVISGFLVGSTAVAAGYLIESSLFGVLILLGPIVPASALIYFRLLGRLGWRMTAKIKKGKKSKS
jgi:hypothetical protein